MTIVRRGGGARQRQLHGRSAFRRAADGDRSAVRVDDALGGREAEPGAARLGREKRREDPLAHIGGNARTVVANRDAAYAVARLERDRNRALPLHRLRAVDEQVLEYDLQQFGVT